MSSWRRQLLHRARCALASMGLGVFPLGGTRFGLSLFHDLKKYAPSHDFRLILDVGANVGEFATAAARAFPRAQVHAFEPVAGTFRSLQETTGRNGRITCHNLALGEVEEERAIALQAMSVHNSLLLRPAGGSAIGSPAGRTETVRVRRLDSLAAEMQMTRVDLLKIDTEGFEREIIRGAGEVIDRTAFVVCEAALDSPGGLHVPLDDLAGMLKARGFRLVSLYDTFYYFGKAPDGYCDALFANHSVLAKPECRRGGAGGMSRP